MIIVNDIIKAIESVAPLNWQESYDNAGLQQTLIPRNNLSGRIRRIASGDPQVSNEIYVLDWASSWAVDKVFGLIT